ncbi:septum formation family protein [Paenarthrobacter nitroguajacolicus]|uniref:septum formation family protein n=1 Tax=Paenarthrobacter nitroguajacolicus TaxID=211146 RepID=UPI004053E748
MRRNLTLPRIPRTAAVAAVLASLLLTTTLTACDQSKPGVGTAHPEVDQCHVILSPEEYDATSEPSPPVACSESHTTQTFLVTTFPQPLANQETRPNQQQLKAAGNRLCTTESLRLYLSATDRDGTTGLAVSSYFPSRDDWAAGSRAVRCDVAITDGGGGPRSISLDLKGALAGPESATLRLCYRQELKDGVLSEDGVDVPCSEPHTAEDVSAWFAQDASLAGPAEQVARCLPFALEFLETGSQPASAVVRPVIRTVGTARTVRCAVAPAEATPTLTTGSMSPVGIPAPGEEANNG